MQIMTQDLARSYGEGESYIQALRQTSLTFSSGEQTAIIGASGSGKTTLLNLLGGLDIPTEGCVLYDENDFYKMNDDERAKFRRRHIGYVFQAYNLIPELSAEDNILLPLLLDNLPKDKEFFDRVTQALGIENRLSHLPGELSGGQQQRVAIARAVIRKPDLLLCDEPTGNLDSKSGSEVIDLLTKLSSELGITLLIITHDKGIACRFNRILTLTDGEVGGDVR